jgi:hypothetical protein
MLTSADTWGSFVRAVRGRPCLSEKLEDLPHPAATELLVPLRNVGAPVEFTTIAWDQGRIDEAVKRGSHASALDYQGFVEHEMVDFCYKGFWVVLPYQVVKHLPGIRISPLGVVPQRGRRPRIIVDYTFSGINQETKKLAPREAMQFGRALDRILLAILQAPAEQGPVYLIKVDLSDGFYRIPVKPNDAPKLALALPPHQGSEQLIAIPLTLPMGWTESPPWFCAATETITDLANDYLGTSWDPPPHPLEMEASTQPEAPQKARVVIHESAWQPTGPTGRVQGLPPRVGRKRHWRSRKPLAQADVFVDDEIVVVQGTPARLRRLKRQLLHLNDLVFRPNDSQDGPFRKEPVSVKKLRQGDATWSTWKVVLGWTVDTLAKTIELPPHRRERVREILANHHNCKRIGTQAAYKLLGELRSMQLGIPGAAGLLSLLQNCLKVALHHKRRVRLNRPARDHLKDLLTLASDVERRPTRIAELFPVHPAHVYGCTDASKAGFGGAVLPAPKENIPPTVWRHPVPVDLQAILVSDDNPTGTLTNSDLELAGTLLHEGILAEYDIAEKLVVTGCDNTPAVSWRQKGSNSLKGPSAYLLREAALHQRRHRHLPRVCYVPGVLNVMADIASRRFDLTDSQLLALFDHRFPQTLSWRIRQVPPEMLSKVISALRVRRPESPSLKTEPVRLTPSGPNVGSHSFLTTDIPILSSMASTTKSKSLGFLPRGCATDGFPVVASPSDMHMFATRSFTSRRRLPNWGPPTRDSLSTDPWTPASPTSTGATTTKIPHPKESSHYP